MKFVMHDIRVGDLLLDRLDKRLPHVHCHRLNGLLLLRAERFPQLVSGLGRPLLHHIQHPRFFQIRQQRDIGLPALETLFIHPQVFEFLQPTSFQTPLHGPAHDLLGRVPTDPQQLTRLADAAAGQQHLHRKALEQQSEAPLRRRPGHLHGLYPVLRTVRARRPGSNQRGKLHRIQMPPGPLRRTIMNRTLPPALRTLGCGTPLPAQFNLHLPFRQLEFHVLDLPRAAHA